VAHGLHRSAAVQTTDHKPTVLVVDDDPMMRDTLRQLLNDAGYAVLTAEDGAAALGALDRSETWPDLVLLDMRMPFMDGPTFFECLRSRPESRRTPVVIVSGTLRSTVRGEVQGITIVKKPFDASKLLDIVDAMVHRPAEDISYTN
jgi:DNA-binding response OmpR family regulator